MNAVATVRRAAGLLVLLPFVAWLATAGACSSDDDTNQDQATSTATTAATGPEDPLPDANDAGPVTCDGCPETDDFTDFEPSFGNTSSHLFRGNVARAIGNGRFYVEGEDGEAYGGNIETDSSGAYSVNVPLICGQQKVKLAWSNNSGTAGVVLNAATSGCRASDIRITLSWDDRGDDFELHLVREGGKINDNAEDCTWTSCIDTAPDWGTPGDDSDNPAKDVDDTDAFGPENIVYPEPADGRYTVLVEHWGTGAAGATGSVVINVTGKPPVELSIAGLDPQHVLVVATIDWPSGTVTPVLSDHDCSANWSGGCRDPIP